MNGVGSEKALGSWRKEVVSEALITLERSEKRGGLIWTLLMIYNTVDLEQHRFDWHRSIYMLIFFSSK